MDETARDWEERLGRTLTASLSDLKLQVTGQGSCQVLMNLETFISEPVLI